MKTWKKLGILLLGALGSCGDLMGETEETPVEISFDVVKSISEQNNSLNDEATYSQNEFSIGPNSRLIMSLGDLKEKASAIQVDSKHRVWAQISLVNEADRPVALEALSLCPLTRSWMMLSNWHLAHPYGRSGRWENAGGDFAVELCKKGLVDIEAHGSQESAGPDDESLSSLDTDPRKIYFDVSEWFQNYVLGRSENFGLILISDKTVEVEGDLSPARSPRLKWIESRSPWSISLDR